MMKIAVVGTGYVGLSNAVLLAQNHEVVAVQPPNFGHYAAITSGFKSFLMIALWYSLGGLSLRLP